MHSMHEQMKAERTRRAVVLTASGEREAAIARAQGQKESAILEAEGVRQRQILEAEGQAGAIKAVADAERCRQMTVAEGQASRRRACTRDPRRQPDTRPVRDQVPRGTAGDRERPRDEIYLPRTRAA